MVCILYWQKQEPTKMWSILWVAIIFHIRLIFQIYKPNMQDPKENPLFEVHICNVSAYIAKNGIGIIMMCIIDLFEKYFTNAFFSPARLTWMGKYFKRSEINQWGNFLLALNQQQLNRRATKTWKSSGVLLVRIKNNIDLSAQENRPILQ